MLSRSDYQRQRVELNQKKSLQPLDADDSKASIYYIRQKFARYAHRPRGLELADFDSLS
jgi:hypothetical protein